MEEKRKQTKERAQKKGKECGTAPTQKGQRNRLLPRRRVRILPRGTRSPRRTIRRRATRYIPPELHRGDAERHPQAVVPEEPTSQDSKAQQMGDGNDSAQSTKGRTSEGDRGHHLRDGATTRVQIKNDKKRKKITKPNHTAEWIHEWLTLTTQLDGTGGHRQLLKRA